MGWFHAIAAEAAHLPSVVWHLCPKTDYSEKAACYYPKAYDTDKFTHATHEPSRLMETANCFYKNSTDKDWVCLEIDVVGLKVNGIETKMEESESDPKLQCPHIFGGIPRECVRKVYIVQRGDDGTFLSVKGLTDMCSSKN
jgi:uncharacterized protein (DUF952 family)